MDITKNQYLFQNSQTTIFRVSILILFIRLNHVYL